MGAVDFSIDRKLVESLRESLPLDVFVETGTFEGEAVARVRELFGEIHTVELSDHYHAVATERFAADPHVTVHHGDAPRVLEELRPSLEGKSVLYWLDAHWCVADETAGEQSQCPLLDELASLGRLDETSVVLVDDARLFLATPPAPHEVSAWPRFHEVAQALARLGPAHELMVVNDVIAFFPPAALPAVTRYARTHGIDWLAELHQRRELERERDKLAAVAAERLEAMESISAEAEERLRVIEELKAAADERLATIKELTAAQAVSRGRGL